MRKIITSILGVALALTMSSAVAFAAPVCDRHFTDADGDGICDYCDTACQYVDADGNGLCDGCGFDRHGVDTTCSGYLDADDDGICDNCHVGRHMAGSCGTGYASDTTACRPARTSHHSSRSHHGRHCR